MGWVAIEVLRNSAAPNLSDGVKLIAQNLRALLGRSGEQWEP